MPQPPHANPTEIAPGVTLPEQALRFAFVRSSGPGGQNVNKLNTKAVLTVELDALRSVMPPWAVRRLTELGARFVADDRLIITASESRSQLSNREACVRKLRELVIQAMHRPRRRKPTRPSRGAVQRRLDRKKRVSQLKASRRLNRGGTQDH